MSNLIESKPVYKALLVLGLALRLGYAWYALGHSSIPTTIDQYELIAMSVVERGEYAWNPGEPTAHREPAFPLLISLVYFLTGGRHPFAFLAVNSLLSVATAWLVFLLGKKLFDERTGKAASAVFLFYPQAVYYSGYFFRETFMALLMTLLALASTHWKAQGFRSERWTLVSGFTAALLALSNSAWVPAMFLAGIALWLAAPKAARAKKSLLFWGPLLAGMLLWTGRNYAVTGRLIPGTTHGGEEFYLALVVPPEHLGTQTQTDILRADPAWAEVGIMPAETRNSRFLKECFKFIARNPLTYARRVGVRLLKFWRLFPYKRDYDHSYGLLVAVSLLSDGWIVPLGLFGLWAFRKRWRDCPAGAAALLGVTAVFVAVHAVIRYRLPLMGLVVLLAVAAGSKVLKGKS